MMTVLSLLFALTASAQSLDFTQMETLETPEIDLPTLTAEAPNVVRGQIVKQKTVRTDEGFRTRYTFAIYEVYAGKSAGMFSLWLPGGTLNGITQNEPGTPSWVEGDEVVLFLKKNGDIAYKGMFTLRGRDLVDPAGRVGVGLTEVIAAVATDPNQIVASW